MSDDIHEQGCSSKNDELNEPQKISPDILNNNNSIKVDEKFVLKLQKGNKNINKEVRDSCKVLHFSSKWNIEEVLAAINGLDRKDYSQLLIFIIEATDIKTEPEEAGCTKLKEKLLKFGGTRPIILQLTSNAVTKIYYKEETSNQFNAIDQQQHVAFPSFLRSFWNGEFNNSTVDILDAVLEFNNRSLVLRFLQTLQLSNGFFGSLALDVASKGSKSEFLAALDSPFESEGRVLSYRSQKYISHLFGGDDPENDDSVLLRAIEKENKEVIDYLITYWTPLIQQLPFIHQVKISTTAFETKQLDVLCDLLEIVDYPFPKNIQNNEEPWNHERLCKIRDERFKFTTAIKGENYEKIDEFVNNNVNLKFVYDPFNDSAVTEAINLKKFGVFYYLKSLGFQGEVCNEVLEKLDEKEKTEAIKQATEQRKKSVNKALPNVHKSVHKLCMQSFIHNRRIRKEQEAVCRQRIMKWFSDIHRIAPEMLDVAASCNDLKIVYDFESESVEAIELGSPSTLGLTSRINKWIFVGAKQSDKKREQEIKGVIAHELCHYVMCLVYNNKFLPYFEDSKDVRDKFDKIVKQIDEWSQTKSNDPDDECNRIISGVFTNYAEKQFHYELIVRAVQLLAQFDDDEDKTKHLQEKYKILFEFWSNQVIPDLQKHLQLNEEVIELNGILDLLPYITKLKYELCDGKDMENMMNNKVVIVQSNVPKLLFINIRKYLQEKFGILFDSQNIFTEPEKLTNVKLWNKFQKICTDNQKLRIFVDCSKEIPDCLGNIFSNKDPSFIFVVSTDEQAKKLSEIFNKKAIKAFAKMEINYNWNDLTEESQKLYLETKINNSTISLMDLLIRTSSTKEPTTSKNLCDVIDDQLLNMVLENENVLINRIEEDEKYFQLLLIPRNFIKKTRVTVKERKLKNENKHFYSSYNSSDKDSKEENPSLKQLKIEELLEFQFFSCVKDKKYVLISDQAGNGKSWTMKNITKQLREQNPISWVTYVDLKQFIEVFKAQMAQKVEPEFSTFMADHILKPLHKFEANIFKKMYENGKVFILFDGFDEIAPNYAEFVSKLANNFQSKRGNQLWIATRDFFEVDLQEKLKLDVAYSLKEMDEDVGVDLIAKSWVLMDLNDERQPKSKEEFEKFLEMSPKYQSYRQKAKQIIKKAFIFRNNSVGLPQLFKVIAVGFKDEDNIDDLQGLKIYIKFIDILYKRWAYNKGQIREDANVKCQHFVLNFHKFHQYHATLSLFWELAKILFPGYNGSEWPEEEVIACGILTKINGKYYFIHETFREFYVAEAIANALRSDKVEEKVLKTLAEVLTADKFEIIRSFLLPVLNEKSILEKVKPQIEKGVYCEENFGQFFTENLENLADFAGVSHNRNGAKKVLNKNAESIARYTQNLELFLKFNDFIINFLKVDDLKELIIKVKIFQALIGSSLEIEIFEELVIKIEAKTDQKFIRQELTLEIYSRFDSKTIFSYLCTSSNLNTHKVNKCLEIMEKFLTSAEIFELMNKRNILHDSVECKSKENFESLWAGIESYFAKQNFPQSFKDFVKHRKELRHRKGYNILHYAGKFCNNIEVYDTLLEFVFKTFENSEDLKHFIIQADIFEDTNCMHLLVKYNTNPAIIQLVFKKLEDIFSKRQLHVILILKNNHNNMNLLQTAAKESKIIGVHQFLLKFFRSFYETYENYMNMLKEVNNLGQNILHIAVSNNKKEIVELIWIEIKSFLNHDQQIEYLKIKEENGKDLIQMLLKNKDYTEDGKDLIQMSLENKDYTEEVNIWVKTQLENYKINL